MAVLGVSFGARGQARYRDVVEEPQLFKINVTEASLGAYTEVAYDQTTVGKTTTTYERIFVGPSLGLDANGSIYHPSLLRYNIATEGAYGWQKESFSGTKNSDQNQAQYLGQFSGSASILPEKPVNANLFSTYSHSLRQYDFFNEVTVDSLQYGGRIGYDHGPWSLLVNYTHREEDITGFTAPTSIVDDVLAAQARHTRPRGSSSLTYTYTEYDNSAAGGIGQGSSHVITANDSERFGSRDQFSVLGNAAYERREDAGLLAEQYNANANLSAAHPHNLSSSYDFDYNRFDDGGFKSDSFSGTAQLQHKLYDSLNSSIFIRGTDVENSDLRGSGYTRRYGGGWTEAYTKKIGRHSRLNISNSLLVEHTDQQQISTVENERHTFSEGVGGVSGSFLLSSIRVNIATIVITDQNDRLPAFVRGIDYDVTQEGERTVITRLAGSRIGESDIVLVDYETDNTGQGNYDTFADTAYVRLTLWDNLWGIYGSVTTFSSTPTRGLTVEDLISYTIGTDVSWKWFRAGAEYQRYDSQLAVYETKRLYESAQFRLEENTSLSFDFTQSWVDYLNTGQQEQNFRFISRLQQTLQPHLRLNLEGGVNFRRGDLTDETLATARLNANYSVGRLKLEAGYDFQYQLYAQTEERMRHLLFVRMKRVF